MEEILEIYGQLSRCSSCIFLEKIFFFCIILRYSIELGCNKGKQTVLSQFVNFKCVHDCWHSVTFTGSTIERKTVKKYMFSFIYLIIKTIDNANIVKLWNKITTKKMVETNLML